EELEPQAGGYVYIQADLVPYARKLANKHFASPDVDGRRADDSSKSREWRSLMLRTRSLPRFVNANGDGPLATIRCPALRHPAGKSGRLPDPPLQQRLVDLVVLVDVEVARFFVLVLDGGDRKQRRAAEESHFDVLREAMEGEEPAPAVDAIE